ncbi:MAG: acetylglutamate kinase [FCB group bacterium]|jgi:acetylglutamate kinase|nr:acetylglutamate kinase [FCB group bacterium]
MMDANAMQAFIQKAGVLVEALPYIREFEGKTIVIKYGGAAMENPSLRRSTAEDICLMRYVGMNPIVVHGGGPAINAALKRQGVQPQFKNGLRVTDEETMKVVESVLAGTINKEIVSLLNIHGGNAVGVCGKDANLLYARQLKTEDGGDLGCVGEVTSVQSTLLDVLCKAGMIPVVAPIATDKAGNTWNINADTAAGDIAAVLEAEKVIFLTDTPGVLRDQNQPESLIPNLTRKEVADLTRLGVISGGMRPKLEACLRALDLGVRKAHIVDGRVPHALLLEIFTDQGMGTLVTQ